MAKIKKKGTDVRGVRFGDRYLFKVTYRNGRIVDAERIMEYKRYLNLPNLRTLTYRQQKFLKHLMRLSEKHSCSG